MRWNEWIHEGFEVWTPPLCQGVRNLPVFTVDAVAAELCTRRRESLIETSFEPRNFVVIGSEVVAWPVSIL